MAAFLAAANAATDQTWLETCQRLYREALASNPSTLSGEGKFERQHHEAHVVPSREGGGNVPDQRLAEQFLA